ncbi:polysaccharide export outer membrane protein [Methylobacterium sp. 174MFSha1.1]|uniref:polysaccharide biosynthesis/export family protein n=1 Tax=Methylobacterium sp. 174MFSha1.1 TaxID=1502749 RepID=UPI0008EFB19E|nr:polysaccharide biosynthesis/export family protein [Methylobacterium sp. 174MFSha1.1]SFU47112.1 polysaccharide export outer membrane protein [Methylobacterium sp. 174MFSha1.1]
MTLRIARALVVASGLSGLGACHSVETSPLTRGVPLAATQPVAEYRIAAEETLDISVFMVPGLTRTVQVDARGRIDLPLIGSVVAGGRTTRELEADIARQLGAKYVRSPQVTVAVKEGLAQRYAVDGAVAKPGIYVAKGETTLLQAIAQAGGPNEVGNVDDVVVIRDAGGRREAARYSLRAIRTGQEADPPVYGKDAVVVGESATLNTLKFVRDLSSPVLGAARFAIP